MKRVLALLGSILLALSSSQASIVISQTNNFSNGVFGAPYDWLQFDSSLGTLTSVVLRLSGSASGNVRVVNFDVNESANVFDLGGRLQAQFEDGSGPKPGELIGLFTLLPATPIATSANPLSLPPEGIQDFFFDEPADFLPVISSNLVSFSSYFIGTGMFQTTILPDFMIVSVGGNVGQFYSEAFGSGVMTLDYTYTTNTPIPEPGTWAAAALLVGGAGYVRWRKRARIS
jgi:hypothetical protein